MIRSRHSLALALIYCSSSLLTPPASCIKVNMLLNSEAADSWQDFFGPETHIQARSLPHHHKKVKKNHTNKHPNATNLQVKSELKIALEKATSGHAILDFLFGILFLTLALPTIWYNEKRQVRMYELISKAEEQCIDNDQFIDSKTEVKRENNLRLVRLHGRVDSLSGVTDKHFD